MKKSISFIFIVFGFVVLSKAQQLPQYSQYMFNDYIVNPAIAGKAPSYEVKSSNRYQWLGITDAPRTYILSFHGPIRSKKMGIGGYLFTDITGPSRRTGVSVTYAYHLKLTESLKLSMGLSGGLLQFTVDGGKIIFGDPGDLILSNGLQSSLVPDFGFGTYLYSDKFYFGFSAPQILTSKLKFFDNVVSASRLATHMYITGGYKFIINSEFTVEPSLVIKYVNPVPVQIDLGGRVIYEDKIWLGTAFRTKDAVSMLIGYTYQDNLTFGYSYDFTLTDIRKYSSGTHEVMIGLKFNKK